MLDFFGVGNSFSSYSPNTSAYFIENGVFYMIDCGENIFSQVNKTKPYKNCNEIVILLTHFHSDHIGSLGTFVFSLRNFGFDRDKIKIFNPESNTLSTMISAFGLKEDCILLNDISQLNKKFKYIKQKHYNNYSYGYLFEHKNNIIFYSGDTSEIHPTILELFNAGKINELYIDTTKEDVFGYHLPIKKIATMLNSEYFDRVFCMHMPDTLSDEEIRSFGFNVASPRKKIHLKEDTYGENRF